MSILFQILVVTKTAEIESQYGNGVPVPFIDIHHHEVTSCVTGVLKVSPTDTLGVKLDALERGDTVLVDYQDVIDGFDNLEFLTHNQGVAADHQWSNFVGSNSFDPATELMVLSRR